MNPKKLKTETKDGFLYHDQNDGWCLGGEGPGEGWRTKDLFHDFDGKQVRVTIEVVENSEEGIMTDEPDATHACGGDDQVDHDSLGWYLDTGGDGVIRGILFCPYCGIRLEVKA